MSILSQIQKIDADIHNSCFVISSSGSAGTPGWHLFMGYVLHILSNIPHRPSSQYSMGKSLRTRPPPAPRIEAVNAIVSKKKDGLECKFRQI